MSSEITNMELSVALAVNICALLFCSALFWWSGTEQHQIARWSPTAGGCSVPKTGASVSQLRARKAEPASCDSLASRTKPGGRRFDKTESADSHAKSRG